jgi:sterol desaturase/sphingolipid hydroxylase (fatty acid hydroxylase superfamily)
LAAYLDPHQLPPLLQNVVRLCIWLVLLAVVFMPLERLFALHPQKYFRKGLARELGYFFINGLVPGLVLASPLALIAWGAHSVMPLRFQVAIAEWPLWQRIVVGFVIGEIGFYWGHRWAHEIPFLWRFHSVHHSPEGVYFLISASAHPLDNAFVRVCGLIPAVFLGVASPLAPDGTLVPVIIVLVATAWGFFIHANLRWRFGPLEWLITTPAFHHWHHTSGVLHDRNYASMLPLMDMIFGTYRLPRKKWPPSYGIDSPMPQSLGGQLLYPFLPAATSAAALSGGSARAP